MPLMCAQIEGAAKQIVPTISGIDVLNSYAHIFVIAFIVTLLATPLARRLAEACGVVDRPDAKRKLHSQPVAYFGGLAVFAGLIAAIAASYVWSADVPSYFSPVPNLYEFSEIPQSCPT